MLQYLLSKFLLPVCSIHIRLECDHFKDAPIFVMSNQNMLSDSCLLGCTQHRLKVNCCFSTWQQLFTSLGSAQYILQITALVETSE